MTSGDKQCWGTSCDDMIHCVADNAVCVESTRSVRRIYTGVECMDVKEACQDTVKGSSKFNEHDIAKHVLLPHEHFCKWHLVARIDSLKPRRYLHCKCPVMSDVHKAWSEAEESKTVTWLIERFGF